MRQSLNLFLSRSPCAAIHPRRSRLRFLATRNVRSGQKKTGPATSSAPHKRAAQARRTSAPRQMSRPRSVPHDSRRGRHAPQVREFSPQIDQIRANSVNSRILAPVIPRLIQPVVTERLRAGGKVIVIYGPRQVGKTTLVNRTPVRVIFDADSALQLRGDDCSAVTAARQRCAVPADDRPDPRPRG
jgi:ATPase subunit of ABC transporter with duplicated ATPase domains